MKTRTLLPLVVVLAACGGSASQVDLGDPKITPAAPVSGPPSTPEQASRGNPPPQNAPAPPAIETVLSGQRVPQRIVATNNLLFYFSEGWVYRYDMSGRRRFTISDFSSYGRTFFIADADGYYTTRDKEILGQPANGCSLEGCDAFVANATATLDGSMIDMAMDATHLYWITLSSPWIYRVYRSLRAFAPQSEPAIVMTPELVAEWRDDDVTCLQVDSSRLYALGAHTLLSIPKSGGTPRRLSQRDGAGVGCGQDDEFVYWVDTQGALYRSPKNGGTVAKMAQITTDVTPSALAAVGRDAVFVLKGASSVASSDGQLIRVSKSNFTQSVVAEGFERNIHFASASIADGHLYWSNPTAGTISRVADH